MDHRPARLLGAALSLTLLGVGLAPAATALSAGGFGPNGEGGAANGQVFRIGAGGRVYELDAFVYVGAGSASQLSVDPLPSDLSFQFGTSVRDGSTDIVLRYELANMGSVALPSVSVLSFVDADIDEPTNTYFNEFATTHGSLAPGQGFEVDEPGFVFGDIFGNLQAGSLDDTNAVPESAPDDVAMAMSFALGPLGPGETSLVSIMLSQDGDSLGSFAIAHHDADPESRTTITYSGTVGEPPPPGGAIPEPTGAVLFGAGLLALRRVRHGRHHRVRHQVDQPLVLQRAAGQPLAAQAHVGAQAE
jgi:hypothetical protein